MLVKHYKEIAIIMAALALLLLTFGCGKANEQTAKPLFVTEPVVYGQIEITDEIRGEICDLARKQRWDFLPWFDLGETPTDGVAYFRWAQCQAQVWAGFDDIDWELTPKTLSKEYLRDLIRKHFAVDVEMPSEPGYVNDDVSFDGENIIVQVGGWANPPDYELVDFSVEELDGKAIYMAGLLEYRHIDGRLAPIERDTLVLSDADKSGIVPFRWQKVQFYVNEDDNEIVFVSCVGGYVDE